MFEPSHMYLLLSFLTIVNHHFLYCIYLANGRFGVTFDRIKGTSYNLISCKGESLYIDILIIHHIKLDWNRLKFYWEIAIDYMMCDFFIVK
jgi:hypothetical protein